MQIVERDRAAAYFADREAGAQVLLCSEIGSEGRNFQFARHLVLFDLPLDPDLLEQRIGRLDRIGQRHTVQVHVPYLQGSASEVAFRWHAQALDAFTAPCPAGSALYRAFREDLAAALLEPARWERLAPTVARERERLNAELEAGRDRLLELHSHRPSVSAALVEAVQEQDADRGLFEYITRFWDLFGVEQEPGPGQSVVLRPGSHMLQEHFPNLPDDGATATFDRGNALAHEDRAFLTWEHPMVRGAMDLLTGTDLGSAAVTALRDARFKPGSLLLEMIYVAECPAPPELQVDRFLPPTALRLLLTADGTECASQHPHGSLRGTCLTRNRKLAAAVIASQAERLRGLLEQGERLAQGGVADLIAAARQSMERMLTHELERLRQLAAVGATVRAVEIERLEEERRRLDQQLARSRLRLDALRVLVTH
jgi:ATP-dependent helicase HepA